MIPEECIKARVTCNAVCTCGWFIHTSWLHVQSNQDTSSKECLWWFSEYWWHGPQWRHNFGGISTWWQHCLWYHLPSVVRNNDPWVVVTPVKCFTEQEMVIPKARYLELGHWTIYSRCRCGLLCYSVYHSVMEECLLCASILLRVSILYTTYLHPSVVKPGPHTSTRGGGFGIKPVYRFVLLQPWVQSNPITE